MDALADVLSTTRAGGTVLARVRAHAPWGLGAPRTAGTSFHAILAGTCWLLVDDDPPRQLGAGDVVVLPRHRDHSLASDPSVRSAPLPPDSDDEVVVDGPGGCTRFFCGAFDHDRDSGHPLVELLPPVLIVSADAPDHEQIRNLLSLLSAELDREGLGSALAVDRLVDVLLVHVLRAWILRDTTSEVSWLAALRDPDIARVLALVHSQPRTPWTIGALAHAAGLSRATLNRRFAELVGASPSTYLTRWRMELAAHRLRTTAAPIAEIAADAGYGSQAAFTRAFARARGTTPGEYRRSTRADAAAAAA
ncbi:MAG: AraC family transcriptional regulator [Solirubrobacteraceae bacterium]